MTWEFWRRHRSECSNNWVILSLKTAMWNMYLVFGPNYYIGSRLKSYYVFTMSCHVMPCVMLWWDKQLFLATTTWHSQNFLGPKRKSCSGPWCSHTTGLSQPMQPHGWCSHSVGRGSQRNQSLPSKGSHMLSSSPSFSGKNEKTGFVRRCQTNLSLHRSRTSPILLRRWQRDNNPFYNSTT